ncbi:MAG TPA: hypothetical protein PLV78_13395 [Deltaproteobacteria bacterium]|nr:hypothetical protein [Deltaproteobacteria bacterium]
MKRIFIVVSILAAFATFAWSQMGGGMMGGPHGQGYPRQYSQAEYDALERLIRISRGGQLYDDWWKTTIDTEKPDKDHPLWADQSTNKRSGYDTYRCKECHGWDYRGKDGAYGKGSHYTGFKGIHEASAKMSIPELEAVNTGALEKHDYTGNISTEDIADLALFMKEGVIDMGKLVDSEGEPLGGDSRLGSYLFRRNCTHMCHGGAGTAINFGDTEKPEFVGTIAFENPWEFIHKVRAGQPGTRMPSAIINGWSEREVVDLLSYARTLPRDATGFEWWGGRGRHMMMHGDYRPGSGRGFGPTLE